MLSWFIPKVFNRFTHINEQQVVRDKLLLDSLVLLLENEKSEFKIVETIEVHSFNPNEVTVNELLSLGFKQPVAARIINYRNKGGTFKVKNDLYKIYGIDSTLVSDLLDHIALPITDASSVKTRKYIKENRETKKGGTTNEIVVKELPMFNLNKADTSMLQTIKGIGSVLSNRIIDFRAKLGGFITTDQLYAIYNLDSVVVDRLIGKVFIEEDFLPVPIMINQLTIESLASHPYISWQQAKLIVAFRNQHGKFLSGEDLLKVYSVEAEDVQKILPYISWATTN